MSLFVRLPQTADRGLGLFFPVKETLVLPQQQVRLLTFLMLVSLGCTEAKTQPAVLIPVVDFGGTPLRVQSNKPLTADERAWLYLASREQRVTVPQGAILIIRMERLHNVSGYWRVEYRLVNADGDTLTSEDAIGHGRDGAFGHALGFLANYLAWKASGAHH